MAAKRQNILLVLVLIVSAIGLFGCATSIVPRQPSSFLFSTKNSTSVLFEDMTKELVQKGYVIKKKDITAGLFVTEPRKFKINSSEGSIKAEQILQLRQEGASLKIRIVYNCAFDGSPSYGPCNADNVASQNKIRKVEKGLLQILKPIFELNKREVATKDTEFSDFDQNSEQNIQKTQAEKAQKDEFSEFEQDTNAESKVERAPAEEQNKSEPVKKETRQKKAKKNKVEDEDESIEASEESKEFEKKWGELKEE